MNKSIEKIEYPKIEFVVTAMDTGEYVYWYIDYDGHIGTNKMDKTRHHVGPVGPGGVLEILKSAANQILGKS